jgi:tyrosine-protein kinase Etk/Wzc
VTQLYGQLFEYETQLATTTAGPGGKTASNEDVIRLRILVDSTRARLLEAAQSQILASDAKLSALDTLAALYAADMRKYPETESEEERLTRQVGTIREMANSLRSDYERARIAEAVEIGDVEVVDPARRGVSVGPDKTIELALLILVSLALGSAAAFARDHFDTAIRQRAQMETVLRIPGLAFIPQISSRSPSSKPSLLSSFANRNQGHLNTPDRLVTVHESRSAGAEAYRALRTNLIFSQAVQTLKRMVVTSAGAGEGKSTVVSNLAVTFAQQGMRVLLLDADLRRPRLHTIFNIPQEPGLTDAVLGRADMQDVARAVDVDNLYVVTSGIIPPNPSELLGSEHFSKLMKAWTEQYDVVLLDSPPLMVASDAAVLAAGSDGVIMVVRAGRTESELARAALQQLHGVGARVIGAVLNDPDAKGISYGTEYGYYAYPSQYYGGPEDA